MKIDLSNGVPVVIGIFTLAGYIWSAAELKAEIKAEITKLDTKLSLEIDQLKDILTREIINDSHKLELHLVEWKEKKEAYYNRFHGIDQTIQHKAKRLTNWINQIAGFLSKQGFVIRDDDFS